MPSARFDFLTKRLAALRQHMLPFVFDPTGTYFYPEKVALRAAAYRILCHAEFEAFVEDRAAEIAQKAMKAWADRGLHTATLTCLIAFSNSSLRGPPDYIHPKPKDQKDWDDLVSPRQRIEKIVTRYLKFVENDNHGIREKNLACLLLPIGIDLRDLDPTSLADIDDFGKKRGSIAHSSSASVRSGIDPKTEFDRVVLISQSFAKIDDLLTDVEDMLA